MGGGGGGGGGGPNHPTNLPRGEQLLDSFTRTLTPASVEWRAAHTGWLADVVTRVRRYGVVAALELGSDLVLIAKGPGRVLKLPLAGLAEETGS